MTGRRVVLVWVLAWLPGVTLGAELALEPTELFYRHEGRLVRAILVTLDRQRHATLDVQIGDHRASHTVANLPDYIDKVVVPVPPPAESATVRVTSDTGAAATADLFHARPWEVYIVPHTHLDIGFTDLQERVWSALAKNLDDVIDLCLKTDDWPEGSRFRWTIEGTALFDNFARRYPPERVEALAALIRDDKVELTGYWANLLTELAGPESLVRATYASRRLADQHDLRIDTVMLNDMPGYTWCLPQLWSQLGYRYANLRANGARAKFIWHRDGAVERPFRWVAPDGSSIVCWYTDSYREANFLRRGFPAEPGGADTPALQRMLFQNVVGHLRRAARTGYDRDVIQLRMGGDNLTAAESVCHWVRHWNDRWEYPRLRLATSREFFAALEKDNKSIPVERGDIPDWWADGAATSAEQTGDARIAHDQAVILQTLSALPGGPRPALDRDTFDRLHELLLLYAEHTWGASRHWYNDNMDMVDQQWAVKRGYVDGANELVADINSQWQDAVRKWATPTRDSIIVFNSLSWPRTDVVRLPATGLPDQFSLRDPEGEVVAVDRWDDETLCFIARDVPPVGYSVYTIRKETPSASADSDSVYSYEVRFGKTGAVIDQVNHRATGRNLVDSSSPFGFNQYVYERYDKREKIFPATLAEPHSPDNKAPTLAEPGQVIGADANAVFRRFTTQTSGPMAPVIEQTCVTYANLDRLEIVNRVRKEATTDVEAIYFAFPFDFDNPRCWLDIPFARMRPGIDQLRYSAADFYSVYHAAEFADASGGVRWATIEAPVVVFGDLWPECWHDETRIDDGTLFSYVMSNTWFTNYRRQQGGDLTFRYAIETYAGNPDPVRSVQFSHEVASPLQVQFVPGGTDGQLPPARSWFAVEPNNVMITSVKKATFGDGLILRLHEMGLGDTEVQLALPEGSWEASLTDVTERDRKPGRVAGSTEKPTVAVKLRRHEIATLRITRR